MFFLISKQPDNSFPNFCQFGEFFISYDNGWTLTHDLLYKGCTDAGPIKVINPDNYIDVQGTFCIFQFKDNAITIETGAKQKFPIFIDEKNLEITNLWRDTTPFHGKFILKNTIEVFPYIAPKCNNFNLTDFQIIDTVDRIIEKNILTFGTKHPLKLFLSGGVDTLILASYVLKNKIPYELIPGEHVEMDYFLAHNRANLKNYWAYSGGAHHWRNPAIVLSGAHGDENLLRSPITAYLMLKHHGEDIVQLCKNNPQFYHSKYFLKSKHIKLFDSLKNLNFKNDQELKDWLLSGNTVDYQHWHLGNTLFFTPFDNLKLYELMLNLSYETAKGQLLDAAVSKELIRRNYPSLLRFLSDSKNENNFRKLDKVYEGLETLEN